ncbi:hypothetical protein JHK87_047448 [Glycine soja]|nr:hypothetical protein JHK87_047448 [Glycine soja]
MKRNKWLELEEQTLLSKYSELLRLGTLAKLKTREKKFKPVVEHVNAAHHLLDPASFPFKWSWHDVSIKVQNIRHQYLGVKQKICLSLHHFNWKDASQKSQGRCSTCQIVILMMPTVQGRCSLDLKSLMGASFESRKDHHMESILPSRL